MRQKAVSPASDVFRVAQCVCRVGDYEWAYAAERRAQIDQHWAQASAVNPTFFDGIVLLTSACHLDDVDGPSSRLALTLFETRFRNFLYWHSHGFAGQGAIDAFGAGIVRASDGALLLVRQHPGNVNEGPFNFPSGFIDRSDVDEDGQVDIGGNVARELAEEVGLTTADMERCPGFVVTRVGVHLAVGVEFRSPLTSDHLAARISAFLTTGKDREIAQAIFVRKTQHLEGLELAPHCRQLLSVLL